MSINNIRVSDIRITNAGFSLTEFMVTATMILILTSIAAPSFASMIQDRQIRASSINLSTTLALARNHALSTSSTVIVCQAKDSSFTQCSETRNRNTNWSYGIISYADENNNGALDDSDKILRTIQTLDNVAVVFNQNGRLRFFADGGSRSAGFYLCSKFSNHERHLKILHTGRTRTVDKMSPSQRDTCLSKVT